MIDFICSSCRKAKKLELLGKTKKNGQKICTSCVEKIKPPTLKRELK